MCSLSGYSLQVFPPLSVFFPSLVCHTWLDFCLVMSFWLPPRQRLEAHRKTYSSTSLVWLFHLFVLVRNTNLCPICKLLSWWNLANFVRWLIGLYIAVVSHQRPVRSCCIITRSITVVQFLDSRTAGAVATPQLFPLILPSNHVAVVSN